MVHELHKAGYQRLRIAPSMSPSGGYWRCQVVPSKYTQPYNGAISEEYSDYCALHGSGLDNRYFEWTDAQTDTARQLAVKFVERFPKLISESEGRDWAYVGWYTEMLGLAEKYGLPYAYADWELRGGNGCLNTAGTDPQIIPPAPIALEHTPQLPTSA